MAVFLHPQIKELLYVYDPFFRFIGSSADLRSLRALTGRCLYLRIGVHGVEGGRAEAGAVGLVEGKSQKEIGSPILLQKADSSVRAPVGIGHVFSPVGGKGCRALAAAQLVLV